VIRAAAALALSGRYSGPGRQAASALTAWARWAGAELALEDDRSEPERAARLARGLARRADLFFGPYGSGPARAVAGALEGDPAVVWNHGGAAARPTAARLVDVLGPAERYWTGLADVLAADGADLARVAIVHAPTGFGRATAAGARASLLGAGARPLVTIELEEADPGAAASAALEAGAGTVVGCGRIEDDLALGRALAGAGVRVALVVCGIDRAREELGPAVRGWLGPAQWVPGAGGPAPPIALPAGAEYPAAQALAAGVVAGEALALAGSAAPDALWDAARALETTTFLGPFRVDAEGRQVAHAPVIVRWEERAGRLERRVAWRPPAG
jgi:ABC-type branched-subunit amino acid transport system substrate-binding protein